ncbi:MAG: type IX secretion system membrane protein PorP/SprF, partial [Sphingobacteriaceae bacterium]|nr:type IX secretion system membrane protein PorP/SprF [Cytophagaceae bacterium]
MKIRLTGYLLGVGLSVALAQDPQFSQVLSDPLYHNPALIGGANQPRVVLHSRWQWPGLGMGYRSHTASFDDFFELGDYGFGYGAQALRDDQGRGTSTTGIGLGLSGRKEISDALTLTAGAQFRFFNTRYRSDFTYVDQFVSGRFDPLSNDPLAQTVPAPLNYRDISIGGMAEYLREAFKVNSLG